MDALLYVCSRLKELALLSPSQLVAGIVHVAHSCSLPLSIFLFSPIHNVLHKRLILHLRAFMRSNKYRILSDALADVSDNNREIAPLSLARSS